jgi:hypothetical protein
MKTKQILGTKNVNFNGADYVVVTTVDNDIIWVKKDQFDTSAETITYTARKAGDKYTDKSGAEQTLKTDRNDFNCLGKLGVAKTVELFEKLQKLGITPAINVG